MARAAAVVWHAPFSTVAGDTECTGKDPVPTAEKDAELHVAELHVTAEIDPQSSRNSEDDTAEQPRGTLRSPRPAGRKKVPSRRQRARDGVSV